MTIWLPMDSAPKDGTRVLVKRQYGSKPSDAEVYIASWWLGYWRNEEDTGTYDNLVGWMHVPKP